MRWAAVRPPDRWPAISCPQGQVRGLSPGGTHTHTWTFTPWRLLLYGSRISLFEKGELKDKSQLARRLPLCLAAYWLICLLLPIRGLAGFAPAGQSNLPLFTNSSYHLSPSHAGMRLCFTAQYVMLSSYTALIVGAVSAWESVLCSCLLASYLHQQQHWTKCAFFLCSWYFTWICTNLLRTSLKWYCS